MICDSFLSHAIWGKDWNKLSIFGLLCKTRMNILTKKILLRQNEKQNIKRQIGNSNSSLPLKKRKIHKNLPYNQVGHQFCETIAAGKCTPLSVHIVEPVRALTVSWENATFENTAVIVLKFIDIPRGNCKLFEWLPQTTLKWLAAFHSSYSKGSYNPSTSRWTIMGIPEMSGNSFCLTFF